MIPVEEFYETRTDSGVEEAFFEKFKKEQLAVALEHLEENDRTLLMFRFGRNMSLKDIAVLMGISEETAKKRSQRAIKKLKKHRPSIHIPPTYDNAIYPYHRIQKDCGSSGSWSP